MVRFLFSIIVRLFLTYSLFLTILISSLSFLLIDEIIPLWDSNEFLILSIFPAFTLPLESNSKKGLDPNFVTGFTDAEGCFMIRIIKDKRQKLGWVVKPIYKIGLHSKDIEILYKIQKFFKDTGTIDTRTNRDVSEFIVQDIKSIRNVIVPHFDNFPLQSAKLIDYQLWKKCILLIANKEHLTQEGLEKIVSIKGALNLGLSDQLKLAFSNIICMERPAYIASEALLNPHWISGFSEGDSSFTFSIGANSVKATYEINLHKREMPLLLKIREFFNSQGNIYNYQTKNSAMFKLTGSLDHNSLIIPHFDKFPLSGLKLHNYLIWKKMVLLISNKLHLTEEGLAELKLLKSTLNKW